MGKPTRRRPNWHQRRRVRRNASLLHERYGALINQICETLDIRLTLAANDHGNYFERYLYIIALHLRDPTKVAAIQSVECHVGLLIQQLARLKKERPDYFEAQKKWLLSPTQKNANYYPRRFEVTIAEALVSKDLQFECPEPPDFRVPWRGGYVAIECARRQPDEFRDDPVEDVVVSLSKKAHKYREADWYNDGPAILALDVTSLNCALNRRIGRSVVEADYVERLADELSKTDFDVLLLGYYLLDPERTQYSAGFTEILSADASPEAREFRKAWMPQTRHWSPDRQPLLTYV